MRKKLKLLEKNKEKGKSGTCQTDWSNLTSHAPTTKETRIFEQKIKSRELETSLNFFKRIATSITTLAPQMIIISKEEEEVEILSQPIVEEQLEQAPEPRPVEEEEL